MAKSFRQFRSTRAGRIVVDAQGNVNHAALAKSETSSVTNGEDKSIAKAPPEIGELMEDGTIYAGISPYTGQDMFVTAKDAPRAMTWKQAMKYASDIKAHGHCDWRLPREAELDVLYQNRNEGKLSGTFNESVFYPDRYGGYYWSSSEKGIGFKAWHQRFADGLQQAGSKAFDYFSVRCIRRAPRREIAG